MPFPSSIQKLMEHFSHLPGIGPKTAERLVFYLLKQDKENLTGFGHTILHVRDNVQICEQCGNISEHKLCLICSDKSRDHSLICVVSEIADILSLEKSKEFNGVYHILNGTLNPTEGITPDKLNIKKLEDRIKNPHPYEGGDKRGVKEIILALNPTIEGETTSMYLTKLLKKYNIKITKLARGLPQGSDLEYADEVTLANAFKGRLTI